MIAGAGRATRYLPIVSPKNKSTEANDDIFLSIDAQEVQNRVFRPLSARKPVSYQREFIDSYQPNVTWYLPVTIRNHLMDKGRRISIDYAAGIYIHHNLCPLSFVDVPEDLYINGLLGIYELNRIELMRDVFVWTYERSCDRYQVVRHTLGEPGEFKDWQKRKI